MHRYFGLRITLGAAACTAALLIAQAAPAQEPLRSAIDGTFAPYAFPKLGGGLEGFNVDLAAALSRRMGREITLDNATFSGLIPALNAGRYDLLMAFVTVTPQRAENLLFTEPYMTAEFQFGLRRGTPPISGLGDLRGKVIAVNKGSLYDSWARQRAAEMGWTVESYDTQTDAVQAVISGRAFANLAHNTAIQFIATRNRQFEPSITVPGTRTDSAIPVRKGEEALRNQIEDALECIKRDGTMAELTRKWFGTDPQPGMAEATLYPGYGTPDMPGYDPTPHEPRC